jgi:oligopeptide transport system permease protein
LIGQIARRVIQVPLVLWLIYTATFLMVVAVPGNPFQGAGRTLSPAVEESLRRRYGMEDNLGFYFRYLGGVLQGDLGQSLQYESWTCNEIIADSLPVSVTVGGAAILIALAGGLLLGTLGAVYRGSWIDSVATAVAVIGISVPTFVIGAALLVLFSVTWPILPAGTWERPVDLVRPALALSLVPMAYITRLTRLGLIDVMGADFIRTARAKGLSERQVILRHALPNALLPVLSYLGPATAAAMTGSFVVERVFNVPGLGVHFVNSVLNRDQMLILATVLVYSTMIVAFNLVVDLAYRLLDPRVDARPA